MIKKLKKFFVNDKKIKEIFCKDITNIYKFFLFSFCRLFQHRQFQELVLLELDLNLLLLTAPLRFMFASQLGEITIRSLPILV